MGACPPGREELGLSKPLEWARARFLTLARHAVIASELGHLAEQAEPALRRALRDRPSPQVRRGVESLLAAPRGIPSAATLRTLRAIRVLELIGSSQAHQALWLFAHGDPAVRPTRVAREALDRLQPQ